LKIGQYLTKIWTITKWDVFFETLCTFIIPQDLSSKTCSKADV